MTDRPPDRLPLWAYVAVNLAVWAMTGVAWWATNQGWLLSPPPNVPRPGAGALLVWVPVAFALASIFDYCMTQYDHRPMAGPRSHGGANAHDAEPDRDA